jgi:hypothetical protein
MQGRVSVWKELPKKLLGQSDFTLAAVVHLIDHDILPQENAEWAESTTERLLSEILVSYYFHKRGIFWMMLKYSVLICDELYK